MIPLTILFKFHLLYFQWNRTLLITQWCETQVTVFRLDSLLLWFLFEGTHMSGFPCKAANWSSILKVTITKGWFVKGTKFRIKSYYLEFNLQCMNTTASHCFPQLGGFCKSLLQKATTIGKQWEVAIIIVSLFEFLPTSQPQSSCFHSTSPLTFDLCASPWVKPTIRSPSTNVFFFFLFFLVNFMCTLEKVQSRTQNRLLIFSYLPTPNPFNELQNVPENESPMVFICKHQFNHL